MALPEDSVERSESFMMFSSKKLKGRWRSTPAQEPRTSRRTEGELDTSSFRPNVDLPGSSLTLASSASTMVEATPDSSRASGSFAATPAFVWVAGPSRSFPSLAGLWFKVHSPFSAL